MQGIEGEIQIVQRALEVLKRETGLDAVILPVVPQTRKNHQYHIPYQFEPDLQLRILIPGKEQAVEYFVEVKKRITRAGIGALGQVMQTFPQDTLLITEYVTPPMAELLKEMGVQFIDAAGNAYIRAFPLYIYIQGKKAAENIEKGKPQRAFQQAGLKVIFALLCNEGLEAKPLRKIAEMAGVALGTVDNVFKDLKRAGYLIDMGKRGRRLHGKERLMQKWVMAYPDVLRPKLLLGRYTAEDIDWWNTVALPGYVYWGGEVAAAKMTKYLKPENVTIYADVIPNELLIQARLKKDPQGEIEIVKTFWARDVPWAEQELVHPLLVYADLLATGDARNMETAKMVYEYVPA